MIDLWYSCGRSTENVKDLLIALYSLTPYHYCRRNLNTLFDLEISMV